MHQPFDIITNNTPDSYYNGFDEELNNDFIKIIDFMKRFDNKNPSSGKPNKFSNYSDHFLNASYESELVRIRDSICIKEHFQLISVATGYYINVSNNILLEIGEGEGKTTAIGYLDSGFLLPLTMEHKIYCKNMRLTIL